MSHEAVTSCLFEYSGWVRGILGHAELSPSCRITQEGQTFLPLSGGHVCLHM